MALVYKAFDTRLEVPRAVKVLKPELDDLARQRFFNEARTMAKLHHKNVVLVHDVADDGQHAYLVMELIEGGSIADRMAAFGPLPPRMACEVAIALLSGLAAAHEQGVVHRDVKPHNILVDSGGVPKVTDFGIAQVDASTTRTGAVIGTWAYMAPEQRQDAKSVDARADVFAVGCTLYNMVTGIDPFDLYNQEVYEQLYAEVPEVFRPVIQRATRYKADDRFPDADAFREALEALLPDLPEDPEDTPPLGVSLEKERAAFVPTLMVEPTHPSQSTISPVIGMPAPKPLDPVGGIPLPWIVGIGLGIVGAVAFGGGGATFLLAMLFTAVPEESLDDVPVEVAPATAASVPDLEAGEPLVFERTASEPEEEPIETVEVPEVAPASEPEPAPRPSGGAFTVQIEVRPPDATIEINGTFATGVWRGQLPADTYFVQFTHSTYGPDRQDVVVLSDKEVCYDMVDGGPCI